MKTSLWDEYTPHIPEEMKYCTKQGTLEERCDWNTIARERAKEMARTIQKIDQLHDMDTSEDMLKRRIRAVVDATPGILERYRHLPGYEPELSDETGETFIQLNFIPVNTYNWQESRAYLLTAAAIWILDEILIPRDLEKRKELFRLLPRDEEILYENLCSPEFWHADYESELVDSVRYVLAYRNMDTAETEVESNKTERVVTSSLIARNAQQTETPSRQAFDRLISLIPEESIQRATAYFEELFEPAVKAAEKNNAPLYCGEYGVIDQAPPEASLR